MPEPVTGRRIVDDLARGGVDPVVRLLVAEGLAAIASQIRTQPIGGHPAEDVRDRVERYIAAAADMVDPNVGPLEDPGDHHVGVGR